MTDEKLRAVEREAARVLNDVDAVLRDREAAKKKAAEAQRQQDVHDRAGDGRHVYGAGTPSRFTDARLTSALRRHSMDLTRALAEMRRR